MNLISDFHHPGLFHSHRLMMERRLGWNLYRMIGMEFFDEWYWQFERSWAQDRYAKMFLPLEETDVLVGDHYERPDAQHPGETFKMLTLEQARDLAKGPDWGIMATVPDNQGGFHKFAKEQEIKFINQVGNAEHFIRWDLDPLGLVSTSHYIPPKARAIRYDQELDLSLYRNTPVPVGGPVASFILVWHSGANNLSLFQQVAESMGNSRKMILYGEAGTMLPTSTEVAQKMIETALVWHTKDIGDGYGQVIHATGAVGRPLFGIKNYYLNKRAYRMWHPDSSFDFTGLNHYQIVAGLKMILANPDLLTKMGEAAYENWKSFTDYDRDAQNMKELIEA